jgi:hypothetical protein
MIYIPKTPLFRSEERTENVVSVQNEHLLNPFIRRVSYNPLANNLFDLCIERISGVPHTHSNAVFVTCDPNQNVTGEYGNTYYFFPRRPFICAWVDVPHDIQQLSTFELRKRFGLPYHTPAIVPLLIALRREQICLQDIEEIAPEQFKRRLLNTIPTYALDDVTPHQSKTSDVYELRIICSDYVLINVKHVDVNYGTYEEFISSQAYKTVLYQNERSSQNDPLVD